MKNPVKAALSEIVAIRQKDTVTAVEAVPADKFNYKPSVGERIFGQLVVHMAEANYLLCGKNAAVPAPKVEDLKGEDSKDKFVAERQFFFDFCSEAVARWTIRDSRRLRRDSADNQVALAWFSLTLAGTWADHYAETAYLRLNGVLPPALKM
jgi:hypothetical protein